MNEWETSTLDQDRMIEIAELIVSITGRLETVDEVSVKFLKLVSEYKKDQRINQNVLSTSNPSKATVFAVFEYFSEIAKSSDPTEFIKECFNARKW